MPERTRARWQGRLVTIIERKGRKVTIRDGGYLREVPAKELAKIDPSEPEAKFTYHDS